ncbi:MAG TPA: hypothetical protein VGJ80_07575 [Gemmatimonadales bacterium]
MLTLALLLTLPLPLPLQVQADTALASFVTRARAGTEAFRNPEGARLAGYHPVGPDFPGMGRHWIHTSLILRPTPDPAQPPVLEYAELNGTPTLVAVAYAVLVMSDTAPASLPVPATAWHFHQGTVDEESFLRSHAAVDHVHPGGGTHGPRLAVVHAWIWLDNPDGLLATDNWALPYARLGLAVPLHGSRAAARALALAASDGGRLYLEALIHAVGQPSDSEMTAVRTVVGRHQTEARQHATRADELELCWNALWSDVKTVVRPEVWDRLNALAPAPSP